MPVVTRDATSGKWTAASAAEWTSLLAGRLLTVANPAFLWLCQEASGSLADSIGTCTMAPTNSPGYQATVSGWSRKAVSWIDSSTSRFDNTTVPPDGGTSSLAFFGFFYVTTTPSGARYMMSLTNWAINIFIDGSGHQGILDNAAGTGTTVVSDGVVRPYLVVYNRAASTCKMYTPTETLDGTYTSSAGVRTVIGAYPALITPAGGCLYASEWTGTNAEMTAIAAANVLDSVMFGPAVTAVAITPSPVNLASLGSTQQMVATATRADTSTFDCTDGTNVPSSATAVWTSDAPSIATVSATGLVTAIAAGTAHITRTFTSLNASAAVSNSVTVTVSGAVTLTSITITASSTPVAGGSVQFTATGNYSDSSHADITTQVTWASDNPKVARIDPKTGIADFMFTPGTCNITATL